MLIEEDESVDKLTVSERLSGTGKLITQMHHNQNELRKAFIYPEPMQQMTTVLKKAKSDSQLFGEKLHDRFKEARAMDKMGQKIEIHL